MKVTVIVAITIDGFIGHSLNERLKLSSEEDLHEVMKLRADCDAVLIGAGTIRKDNSTLITRDEKLIHQRQQQDKCKDPLKVTLTRTGNISLECNFLKIGECEKIIYTTKSLDKQKETELNNAVNVMVKIFETETLTAKEIVDDLQERGVDNLIVEGGTEILTMFFEENLVDELRLSVVPFFVGDKTAPRFTHSGVFHFNKDNRMKLEKVEQLGDTAVMHYKLKS